ncbi:hypothetical protein OIO90_005148 [Microbotryomycetes sp. JL221]|nr:hypothetical protein OIO90_005148 [Microbotryomycetes sp. JL221]
MDNEAPAPSPVFKRRPKSGLIKPSSSTSSLRNLTADDVNSTQTTTSNAPIQDDQQDEGNVVVVRTLNNNNKKNNRLKQLAQTSPAAAQTRPAATTKLKSRLSFGLQRDPDEDNDSSIGDDSSQTTSASPATTNRRLFRPQQTISTTPLSKWTQAQNDKDLPTNLDQATISAAPATQNLYSKSYLQELKAQQLSTPPPAITNNNQTAILRGDYDDLTKSKFASSVHATDDDNDNTTTSIPSSTMIEQLKKKRELLKQSGSNQFGSGKETDYISLQVGFVNKTGDSRLVREEDELGDGDDDVAQYTGVNDIVPLGKKANKDAAKRMKEGMIDLIDEAEDEYRSDDEETREWEQAQIKRGEQQYRMEQEQTQTGTKRGYRPAPIPQPAPLPTVNAVTNRLSQALASLESAHDMDSATLSHFNHEKLELEAQEQELRTEVTKIEQKSRWFEEFKTFIEDVAAFLDEKFPQLEKIEQDNLAIQTERYDIVAKRRFADDSDDVALFTGAHVRTTLARPVPPLTTDRDVDELGRSRAMADFELAPKSATRTARRQSRLQRANKRKVTTQVGSLTDDELDEADSQDLKQALASLNSSLMSLFDDVKADDFRDPNLGIKTKFQEWRTLYNQDYENAFGGLAIVGVWEFWARVEMAMWNPFEISQLAKSPPGLDAYQWHSNLTAFGHAGQSQSREDDDDSEMQGRDESEEIVNLLVTSVVVTRLIPLAKQTYDAFSRHQTVRALGLVDEVSYCVEKSSPKFEQLVRAFVTRVQIAVRDVQRLVLPCFNKIKMPQNASDPDTFEAKTRFLQRLVKLLDNATKWRRYGKSLRLSAIDDDDEDDDHRTDEQTTVGAGGAIMYDELLQRELVAKVMLPIIEASYGANETAVLAQHIVSLLPADAPRGLKDKLSSSVA